MRVAAFTSLCQATSLCVRRLPSRNKYFFFPFFFQFFCCKIFQVFLKISINLFLGRTTKQKKEHAILWKKKYVSSHVCPMWLKPREKLRTTSDSHVQTCKITCFLRNFFGKSRRLHLGLESLEIAKFGRAFHAVSWAAGPRRIRLGRESRDWVFPSRKSENGNSWSRESEHTKYESRYSGHATFASVTKVWKFQVLVAKVRTCLILILVWKVLTCQNFVAKVWTWVWDLDPGINCRQSKKHQTWDFTSKT